MTKPTESWARFGVCLLLLAAVSGIVSAGDRSNVLIITVDTLRADHLSSYGYERPTSPNIDRLIEQGVRFTEARTPEPLTAPALASLITARYPHDHGATRNGLRIRTGLSSLPRTLEAGGYRTAAIVSNWTLRDKLSGLAEHFGDYEEVLTRARWFGLVRREAMADDITEAAIEWIADHARRHPDQPFMLWVHYTDPHAPYRLHKEYAERLGLPSDEKSAADKYDTEIAFVDNSIGELLSAIEPMSPLSNTIVAFAADHGESLGEHDYWGHGRNLYEPNLRIPMAVVWKGRLNPGTVDAPAVLVDLGPTILGLLGDGPPEEFDGFDWAGVLDGDEPPTGRITHYEAHKGAVISKHKSDLHRRSGLLSVGMIHDGRKEIFRIQKNRTKMFDLNEDPLEVTDLTIEKADPTEALLDWMVAVYAGLTRAEDTPLEPLDEESIEQLRSLGYVD